MTKKSRDIKEAMRAVDDCLQKYDRPTQAMAASCVAGIYAGSGNSEILRMAGIGANVEAMVQACNETASFNTENKRKRNKAGTVIKPRRR